MPKKRYLDDDKKNNDVLSARGRLKGALQDVFTLSEDEDNDDLNETDEEYKISASKKPYSLGNRGRPPKRFKRNDTNDVTGNGHRSYFMKLFDRSVDLARFDEETPLYPICRAWMANKPRFQKIPKNLINPDNKHVDIDELKNMIESGNVTNITSMPIPDIHNEDEDQITRIPSPLPCQKDQNKNDININYNLDDPPFSKEELMKNHLKRWSNIKQKWHQQTNKFETKYELNINLLKCLYKQ